MVQSARYLGNDVNSSANWPGSNGAITYDYDALGNIQSKSDYGSAYQYGSRPHAVSQVTLNDLTTAGFSYDNNGNMTGGTVAGATTLTVNYDPSNKPTYIDRNGTVLEFSYGPNQQRFYQLKGGDHTTYIDKLFEEYGNGHEKHYIGDYAVLNIEDSQASLQYLHRDRLGSIVAITNQDGERYDHGLRGFDPFGKPREGDWQDSDGTADPHTAEYGDLNQADLTTRGFTAHEHLNSVDLIHMNGRAYDYNLGRFLSVDPFIQFPANSQSLNPYSYILNNPMSGTDPTGYMATDDTNISGNGAPTGSGSANDQRRRNVTGSRVRKEIHVKVVLSNGQEFVFKADEFGVSNGGSTMPTTNTGGDGQGAPEGSGAPSQKTSTPALQESGGQGEQGDSFQEGGFPNFVRGLVKGASDTELGALHHEPIATNPLMADLLGSPTPAELCGGCEFQSFFDESTTNLGQFGEDLGIAVGIIAGVVSKKPRFINPRMLIGRQNRNEMSGSLVKRLRRDMSENGFDEKFPVEVADVDGKFIILQGHHRTRAAIGAGIKEIPVNVTKVSRKEADQLLIQAAESRL